MADELETGQRLFNAGRYAEAMPMLQAATHACPEDEILWQKLVRAASLSGRHAQAVEFAKEGVHRHPRSVWFWGQLGSELTAMDLLDEAERALENARRLDPNWFHDPWLWRYFANLHRKRKNLQGEIEALECLDALGGAYSTDLWQLGLAYYNLGNFAKAVEYYRRSAALAPAPGLLFNMGLAFNHPEVSQDADAADAYRRALLLNPNYESATKQLEITKQRLVPLATNARAAASGLVEKDEAFQFYLNPFEALHLEANQSDQEFDVKACQRAKKRLLQEIDLNESKVSWLGDHALDKSRALALEDELYDEKKRRYHWAVYQNKRLLRFLTHGDIEHFLYSDDYFPRATLELLDEEPEFRAFLSKPFARQYNFVLTRAIERRLMPVVEVLFDGRRWVKPEDEDTCFERADKRVADLVALMRSKSAEGRQRKVSLRDMEDFLQQHSYPQLFNLLPTAFRRAQTELVEEIRSLAIACCNEHGDYDLSQDVLNLCKRFQFKSAELNKRLEEDFKAIQNILADEQKHSFSASVGLRRRLPLVIDPGGIRYGTRSIKPGDLESVRWWGSATENWMGKVKHTFVLVARSQSTELFVQWQEEQEILFQKVIEAVLHYLVPALVTKLVGWLMHDQGFGVGPCTLSRSGIAFHTGVIFRKDHFVSWTEASTQLQSGQIFVHSKNDRKAQISMAIKDTDNAVILPILCAMMQKEG